MEEIMEDNKIEEGKVYNLNEVMPKKEKAKEVPPIQETEKEDGSEKAQ